MLLFYSEQILQYKRGNDFFWNWYKQQQEQKKGILYWEKEDNHQKSYDKKVVFKNSDVVESKKYQTNDLIELENIKNIETAEKKEKSVFDKEKGQYRNKELKEHQKQYQKQYEYEKKYEIKRQMQQQYDIKKQYRIEQQKQYTVEQQNRYDMQEQEKSQQQKEYEQRKQKELQQKRQQEEQRQYDIEQQIKKQQQCSIQKRNEQEKKSVWKKEKEREKYSSDIEKQQYYEEKEQARATENFYKKEQQKIITEKEIKKDIKNNYFWKYGNFLDSEIKNKEIESVFWLGKDAFQQKEWNHSNIVYYEKQKEELEQSVQRNEQQKNLQQKEDSFVKNEYEIKSVWKKGEEKQKKEQNQKINIDMIQNIVKNSIEERVGQNQKREQMPTGEKSVDVDALFLNITERLLEQRERSLRRNTLKV